MNVAQISGDLGFGELDKKLSSIEETLTSLANKKVQAKVDVDVNDEQIDEAKKKIDDITSEKHVAEVEVKMTEADDIQKQIDALLTKKKNTTVEVAMKFLSKDANAQINDYVNGIKQQIIDLNKHIHDTAEDYLGNFDWATVSGGYDSIDLNRAYSEDTQDRKIGIAKQKEDIRELLTLILELQQYYKHFNKEVPEKYSDIFEYFSDFQLVGENKLFQVKDLKSFNEAAKISASDTIAKSYAGVEEQAKKIIQVRHAQIDAEIEALRASKNAAEQRIQAEKEEAQAVEDAADRIVEAEKKKQEASEETSVSSTTAPDDNKKLIKNLNQKVYDTINRKYGGVTELSADEYSAIETKINGIAAEIEKLGGNSANALGKLEKFKEGLKIADNKPDLLSGADATVQWIENLDKVEKQSKATQKAIKEALKVSRNADAGSGVEVLESLKDLQSSAEKTAESTKEAASGLEKEGQAAKDAAKNKEKATKANKDLSKSAQDTADSAKDAAKGLGDEGKASKKVDSEKAQKEQQKQDMAALRAHLGQMERAAKEEARLDAEKLARQRAYQKAGEDMYKRQAAEAQRLTKEKEKQAQADQKALDIQQEKESKQRQKEIDDATLASYRKEKDLIEQIYKLKKENANLSTGGNKQAENDRLIVSLQQQQVALQDERKQKYLENVEEAEKLVSLEKQLAESMNNQSRSDIATDMDKQYGALSKVFNNPKITEDFKNEVQSIMDIINQLSKKAPKMDTSQLQKAWTDVREKVDEAIGQKGFSRNQQAAQSSLAKLRKNIEDIMAKNTAMGRDFQNRFDNLKLRIDTSKSNADVELLKADIVSLEAELIKAGQAGRSFGDILKERITGINAQFLAQYFGIQDWIRYIREAVTTIKDLDYQLVDLRKTTTMSADDLNEFYMGAHNVAKELGTTTSQIISQAAAWSRLGYSSKEAATEMAELSSQFAAISPGMSLDDATDGLVSTMQAFHIDVEDTERQIMDNVNRIGNTFATTNGEIMEMLKRSSAAMKAANNSIEETIALESAAVQITRNAETTGTAFRTISMRIRGFDEETEELSEDLVNISGEIANLTKTAKSPNGITIFTDDTRETYKSTYQILKDISEIWDQLTDKQQAGLLEKIGGKRGAQSIADLLSDFSEVERAMNEMAEAEGAADAEMGIITDSLEYKINALKETWVGILQELVDRGVIGDIVDALTLISECIEKITKNAVALKSAFGGGIGALMSLRGIGLFDTKQGTFVRSGISSAIDEIGRIGSIKKQINTALSTGSYNKGLLDGLIDNENIRNEVDSVVKNVQRAGTAGKVSGKQISEAFASAGAPISNVSRVAMNLAGTLANIGLNVGISIVIGLANELYQSLKNVDSEMSKMAGSLSDDFDKSKVSIEKYKEEIEELRTKLADQTISQNESTQARERLLAIQDELISKYGTEAGAINDITLALTGQIDALDRLTDREWQEKINQFNNPKDLSWTDRIAQQLWRNQNGGAATNYDALINQMESKSISFKARDLSPQVRKYLSELEGVSVNHLKSNGAGGPNNDEIVVTGNNLKEIYNTLLDIQSATDGLDNSSGQFTKSLNKQVEDINNTISEGGKLYDESVLRNYITGSEYEQTLKEAQNAYDKYIKEFKSGTEESAQEALNDLKDIIAPMFQDIDDVIASNADNVDVAKLSAVKDYFENLFKQAAVEIQKDKFKEVRQEIYDAFSLFDTKEDILNFDGQNASSTQIQAYKELQTEAEKYGMSLDELIEKLTSVFGLELPERSLERASSVASGLARAKASKGESMSWAQQSDLNSGLQYVSTEDFETAKTFTDKEFLNIEKHYEKIKQAQGDAISNEQAWAEATHEVAEATRQLSEAKQKAVEVDFNRDSFSDYTSQLEQLQNIWNEAYENFSKDASGKEIYIPVKFDTVEALKSDRDKETGWGTLYGKDEDFAKTFDFFEDIVTNANSTKEQVQAATEEMATAYSNAFLNMRGATAENVAVVQSQLELLGFTKDSVAAYVQQVAARQTVESNLISVLREYGVVSQENINQLIAESEQLGLTNEELQEYILAGMEANGLVLTGDISWLDTLLEKLGLSISEIRNFKSEFNDIQSINAGGLDTDTLLAEKRQQRRNNNINRIKEETLAEDENTAAKNKNTGATNSNTKANDKNADAVSDLSSELNKLETDYKNLKKICDTYNETGSITLEQAQQIADMDFKALAAVSFDEETGAAKLDASAMQNLNQAKIEQLKIQMALKAYDLISTFKNEGVAAEYLASQLGQAAMNGKSLIDIMMSLNGLTFSAGSQGEAAANLVKEGLLDGFRLLDNVTFEVEGGEGGEGGGGGGGASSEEEAKKKELAEYKEKLEKDIDLKYFDWIEIKLDKLDKDVQKWVNSVDRLFSFWNKNWAINKSIQAGRTQIAAQESAYQYYLKFAKDAAKDAGRYVKDYNDEGEYELENVKIVGGDDLAKVYRKLFESGKMAVEKFNGHQYDPEDPEHNQYASTQTLYEKLQAYQEWYDKAISAQEKIAELYQQERDLIKSKLNNVIEYFDTLDSYFDSVVSKLDSAMSVKEASGQRKSISDLLQTYSADFESMLNAEEKQWEYRTGISKKHQRSSEEVLADINTVAYSDTDLYKNVIGQQQALLDQQEAYADKQAEIADLKQMIKEETDKAYKKELQAELKVLQSEAKQLKLTKSQTQTLQNMTKEMESFNSIYSASEYYDAIKDEADALRERQDTYDSLQEQIADKKAEIAEAQTTAEKKELRAELKQLQKDAKAAKLTSKQSKNLNAYEGQIGAMANAGNYGMTQNVSNAIAQRDTLRQRKQTYQELTEYIAELNQAIKEETDKAYKKELQTELKQVKKEAKNAKLSANDEKILKALENQVDTIQDIQTQAVVDNATASTAMYQELVKKIGNLQQKTTLSASQQTTLAMYLDELNAINAGIASDKLKEYISVYEKWSSNFRPPYLAIGM